MLWIGAGFQRDDELIHTFSPATRNSTWTFFLFQKNTILLFKLRRTIDKMNGLDSSKRAFPNYKSSQFDSFVLNFLSRTN